MPDLSGPLVMSCTAPVLELPENALLPHERMPSCGILFSSGKSAHHDLSCEAKGVPCELAGRAVRKGESPERTQTPCSLTLDFLGLAAQAAMVTLTLTAIIAMKKREGKHSE